MSNCFAQGRVDVRGRWKGVLESLGVPSQFLTGKHSPCPMCGGKDRFRFLNTNGDGTYICNGCGNGNGFSLVMRWKDVDFLDALDLVRPLAGSLPAHTPSSYSSRTTGRNTTSSPAEKRQ